MKTIHGELLKILLEVVKFLDAHDLPYSLNGGTLLGAIRHKGFIPWDDDVDIMMPRPAYEKLRAYVKKHGTKISDSFHVRFFDVENITVPFCKAFNENVLVNGYNKQNRYEQYLWIDIFPVDGWPDTEEEVQRLLDAQAKDRRLLLTTRAEWSDIFHKSRHLSQIPLKVAIKLFAKTFGVRSLTSRIDRRSRAYGYYDTKIVGSTVWTFGEPERMSRPKKLVNVDFEGHRLKAIDTWEEYLTNVFGDYMKLPPKEDRVTHGVEIKVLK